MTFVKKLFLGAVLISTVGLGACASNENTYSEAYDPLEPYNRAIFAFNNGVDYVLLDPLTEAYRFVVPDVIRLAISNFLTHIKTPVYLANELLQGDLDGAGLVTKRFVLNSFTGFGGIVDTASWEGMTYEPEDFGQTLAVWGVGSGPYMVLPLFGPSTTRDSFGLLGDMVMDPINWYAWDSAHENTDVDTIRMGATIMATKDQFLDLQKDLKRNSLDYYAATRSVWLQRRQRIISLIILAWVFATMGVFARYLGTEFQLFEQTYLRIAIALIISSLIFSYKVVWAKYLNLNKSDALILIFRAVCLYLGVVFITEGLLNANYANASIVAVVPLMPIMAYFLLKERISWKTVGFIIFGFSGVCLMSLDGLSFNRLGYGEMMAFISLIFFDLSYIGRKWHSNYLNNYETTIFMFFVGSIFLFITSITLGEGLPTSDQFSSYIMLALLGGAIFNVINLLLTNYGFQHVKASVAGNILTLEVVFALAYGLFLFKEIP